MIKIANKLPREIYLAVSGGVDSVAALDFLSRNHNVTILHVNHKEGNSDNSEELVNNLSKKYCVPLIVKTINSVKPKDESLEEFWRNERYELFHSLKGTVVTAHTLDDCVETWLWSSLHGCGKIIPYENRNVVRPFLQTQKSDFLDWAKRKSLYWIEDESNANLNLTRNYIRQQLLPHALKVNPGLYKTILKKVKTNVC